MPGTASGNKHQFKADIVKLLDIITHSVYTNREIFLRELISNASDALEKLRFEQSRGTQIHDPDLPLEIKLSLDKTAKVLTIADTGIGMNEVEIIENIGSIAHSGTEQFLKAMSADSSQAGSIIGRFGVGFYSVFMVADKVVLTTRSAVGDEPAWEWTSDGLGGYELNPAQGSPARGTSIAVHLKEQALDFLEPGFVKEVINRHSHFISFPILVDDQRVNTVAALWREPKSGVTQDQYQEFYTFLTHDPQPPMETIHINVDAPVQFSALVFIPAKGEDMFALQSQDRGLDLYARRVLITRGASELLPDYLSFCKGMADSEDLPLNLSRETLQENRVLKNMAHAVQKDILARLTHKAKSDPEGYKVFWQEHGKVFKLAYNDFLNRETIAELLRFDSSALEEQGLTGLADYAARAKAGQKKVYYLSGSSRAALEMDPHLEIFKRKGLEVLYLYEPIDEFALESLGSYKELGFLAAEQVAAQDLADFPDLADERPAPEALSPEQVKGLDELLAHIKEVLGDRVSQVRRSERLRTSPSCLVASDGQMSSRMQKILKVMSKDESVPVKIMEINPDHALIRNLLKIQAARADDPFIADTAEQLYESALLLEGYLADPHKMVGRINAILERASGWYAGLKSGE